MGGGYLKVSQVVKTLTINENEEIAHKWGIYLIPSKVQRVSRKRGREDVKAGDRSPVAVSQLLYS